jgi:hypothetical protein
MKLFYLALLQNAHISVQVVNNTENINTMDRSMEIC